MSDKVCIRIPSAAVLRIYDKEYATKVIRIIKNFLYACDECLVIEDVFELEDACFFHNDFSSLVKVVDITEEEGQFLQKIIGKNGMGVDFCKLAINSIYEDMATELGLKKLSVDALDKALAAEAKRARQEEKEYFKQLELEKST